jgi:hypothetical protein
MRKIKKPNFLKNKRLVKTTTFTTVLIVAVIMILSSVVTATIINGGMNVGTKQSNASLQPINEVKLRAKESLANSKNTLPYEQSTSRADYTFMYHGPQYTGIGYGGAATWEGAMRLTPDELGAYADWNITKINYYYYDSVSINGKVKIYHGGTSSTPGALWEEVNMTQSTPGLKQTVLPDPIPITGTEDIWVSIEWQQLAAGYPFGADAGPAVDGKGDWLYDGSSWYEIQTIPLDYNWVLEAYAIGALPPHDVGVTSIDAPISGDATGPITPKATVGNFGTNDETDVPVEMNIVKYGSPTYYMNDGFETYIPGSYIYPSGWTIQTTNPTGTWYMYSSSLTYSASTYPRVQEAGSDGNAQDESLISPSINCAALSWVNVQFTKYFYPSTTGDATFTLYISNDDGSNWIQLVQYTSSSSTSENINVTTYAAGQSNVKFKFRFESPADATLSSYMYFDNFWVGSYLAVPWGPLGDVPPIGWDIQNYPSNPSPWTQNFWHRYTSLYTSYDSMYYPARIYYVSPYVDVNNALITPSIDCSALSTVKLYINGYFYYYAGYTHGCIEVSNDGGSNWNLAWDFTATLYNYEFDGYNNFDITQWAAGQSNVKIRFRYYHTAAENGRYWYLGNVRVGSDRNNIIFYDSFQGVQAYSTNFKIWVPDNWVNWAWDRVTGVSAGNQWLNVLTGSSPTCSPPEGVRMAEYNSYSATAGNQARIYTINPYNVASAPTLKMSFKMFHDSVSYQTTADKIEVQVSTDGTTWTTVGDPFYRSCTLQGLPLVDGWHDWIVDLSAYAGETSLQIGFLATSQYGYNMFIDAVTLFDPGVIPLYTQTVNVDVDSGHSVQVTFPDWTPPAWHTEQNIDVTYDVIAKTNLVTDMVPENDGQVETFELHFPFFDDMEVTTINSPNADGPGQTLPVQATIKNVGQYPERNFFVPIEIGAKVYSTDGWFNNFESNNGGFTQTGGQWEYGTPTSGPMAAYSGTKLWATILAGDYVAGEAMLDTVPITVPTGGDLSFWHWYDFEANYDGYNVKISTSPYTTWTLITPEGGYSGTASQTASPLYPQPCWTGHVQKYWEYETFDLAAYEGQTVKFRFDMGADTSVFYPGAYVDDILVGTLTVTIEEEYNESVAVTTWLNPGESRVLNYPDWTPENLGLGVSGDIEYGILAEAQLTNDGNPANDQVLNEITLSYWHDVLVKSITQPSIGAGNRDIIKYHTGYNNDAIGLTSPGTWEGAMRLTPTELGPYDGWNLNEVNWYHYTAYANSHSGNIKIYGSGTATQPGSLLTSEPFTATGEGLKTITLSSPVTIDASGDLWVSVEIVQTIAPDYPFGVDAGPAVDGKGDWAYIGGSWMELQTVPLDYNWVLEAVVEEGGPGPGGIDIYIAPGTESVQSIVKNEGTFVENDLTSTADIYEYITDPENGTLVYQDEVTGINLNPLGEEKTLSFDSYNFANEGIYWLTTELQLGIDDLPNNNIKDLGIGVDNTKPQTTHALTPAIPDGLNGWYKSDVKVKLTATDPEVNGVSSGVKEIRYKVDSGSEQKYTAEFTVSTDGSHTVYYYAIDNVGNAEVQKQVSFKIDKTAPEIALQYEVTGGSQVTGWTLTFTATASDAMSGMDRVEFYYNDVLQETVNGSGPTYTWVLENYNPILKVTIKAVGYDMAGLNAFDQIVQPKPVNEQSIPSNSPTQPNTMMKINLGR